MWLVATSPVSRQYMHQSSSRCSQRPTCRKPSSGTSITSVQQESLVELIRRAQNGSNEAAQVVYDRCREPLLKTIRKVITRPIRRLYDSEDFLLATFRQIFTRHFSDEVLASPQILWPYIKRIAENPAMSHDMLDFSARIIASFASTIRSCLGSKQRRSFGALDKSAEE